MKKNIITLIDMLLFLLLILHLCLLSVFVQVIPGTANQFEYQTYILLYIIFFRFNDRIIENCAKWLYKTFSAVAMSLVYTVTVALLNCFWIYLRINCNGIESVAFLELLRDNVFYNVGVAEFRYLAIFFIGSILLLLPLKSFFVKMFMAVFPVPDKSKELNNTSD